MFACLLYIVSSAPVEKRICLLNDYYMSGEPTESWVKSLDKVGWQNEYVPQIYYDYSYSSEYSSSLYQNVRQVLIYNSEFSFDKETYMTPAFLEGEGTFAVESLNSPSVTFTATITSDEALIQIPQFYYDGYQVRYYTTADSVDPAYKAQIKEVDGLVAFTGVKGTYRVEVTYVGSKSYRIALPFLFISVLSIVVWGVGETIYNKKKKPLKEKQS